MEKLKSSNLDGYDYNQSTKELEITFKNGTTYKYKDVDPTVITGLLDAPSSGSYFAQNIKGNYKFEKV